VNPGYIKIHMGKQERQNSVLCKTEEGTVEDTMSSPTILEAIV